jgi:selenocysteine-specific elongation factor
MNRRCILGGGRILEVTTEKFRTANAEKTLAYLQPLQKEDVKSFLSPYFSKFPNRPVTVEEIVSATGFSVQSVEAVIKSRLRTGKLLHFDGRGYFERSRYDLLKSQLVQSSKKILSRDSVKLALNEEEIRCRLSPDLDNALFEKMLGDLCNEEELVRCEGGYRIPNLVISHPRQRERLVEKVIAFAKSQGCATFSVGTFKKLYGKNFTFKDVEKAFNQLYEQKKLVLLNDGRFLNVEAMQEIKDKVSARLQKKGSIAIKDCKEILGYGRTRAVPILDYLDEIGLTCRVGDIRVLVSNNNMRSKQGRR